MTKIKTTPQKILKTFLKARMTSDIKPELQAVYVHQATPETKKLVCTDSFRLHILNYSLIASHDTQLQEGIYNPDTFAHLKDYTYPEYTKILHTHEKQPIGSLELLSNTIIKTPIHDIKQNNIMLFGQKYNKKYINEAIAFLKEVEKLNYVSTDIEIYTKDNAPMIITLLDTRTDTNNITEYATVCLMPMAN